ncbi:MAG: xanthine dehydrogenase family protein molybdopterin-binding subunit [Alphaproteobacteria bacterium]|nr:xanthine dehydrogenase family protein molybdopterin-binding subunit [Alphaproteobacteria bacterium]
MAMNLTRESSASDEDLKVVGTRPRRPDGVDKVTGRAKFGADLYLPGMLVGKTLRSPHAHARIRSIDTSKAEALAGVKAVVTRDDFPDMPVEYASAGELVINFYDVTRNMMAREKVLYDGHPVAAVAATSEAIARKALKLIEVEYEILPHVIDVVEAMKPDAPLLHEEQYTQGLDPKPKKPSNLAKRVKFAKGDMEAGFKEADIIVEREFNTKPVHQGYIEPQACVVSTTEDGQVEIWTSTQGHFVFRAHCARLLEMDIAKIRVTASEIGGGFGGKNNVYGEPLAIVLSRKSNRPVKMVMSRDEVFRATGPTSGANIKIKMGCTRDGTITAAQAELNFQAGAFAGSSVPMASMCAFTRYDLENLEVIGNDVTVNRPKVAAYRAPGAPIAIFGVESVVDEMAKKIEMDPLDFRLKNAAKEGTKAYYGPTFGPIGYIETLEAAKKHAHYKAKLGPDQGRGVATGFWFNIGGETSTSLNINEDGSVTLTLGTPDVAGGSRAAMAMMVAEEFGIPFEKVRPVIGDTSALGYNFITAGSRATFASGMASVQAARQAIGILCERAGKIWDVPAEGVVWENGFARPASSNVGEFEPLSLADIAKVAGKTGGAIAGHAEINAQGAGPGFGTHIVDVEVDRETGRVKILRYTVVQDAGKAIHPAYVEGQFQGGAVQGIGWALNEEYVYGEDGRLQNPGFLDYRMPVASDVPMIDTVIVEVPNPKHPYGVRGIGEVPIIPPMAAIANAVENATGLRFQNLPMSPPRVLAAIDEAAAGNGRG